MKTPTRSTKLLFGLGLLLTTLAVACSEEPTSPRPGDIESELSTPASSAFQLPSHTPVTPIDPLPIFLDWAADLDYQAWLDDTSYSLFRQTGMALTLDKNLSGVGSDNAGTSLFQTGPGQVTTSSYVVSVASLGTLETGSYTDSATGDVVSVELQWFTGTIKTDRGSVDAYMTAVKATHPQLEEYYLVPIEPGGNTAGRYVGDEFSFWDNDFEDETSNLDDEEDPCGDCIDDHNKARNKHTKRYKRCRRKALFWGGGATIIASFGGPWGTAGGLAGTAAALDACNDTYKDAKADAIEAFCDCWAENDCDPNNSNYKANCN